MRQKNNLMKKILISGLLFTIALGFSQDKKAYQVFDKKGKKSSYSKLLKASQKSEVVLFGEHHNNSIVHWLQLELTKDLAEKKQLVLERE